MAVAGRGVETQGKVIPRWMAGAVDRMENLVFMGNLERLWQQLIEAAGLRQGERVIDVGCGSGQIAVWVAYKVGGRGEVIGIDASEKMIEFSKKRAQEQGADVEFKVGVMENLPFGKCHFDAVLSSQALHHLPRETKFKALNEMRRVLKTGGRLVILDHGKPYSWPLKVLYYPFRWNIFEYQRENIRGQIPDMISAVFGNCHECERMLGWMKVWKAVKN